MKVHSKLAINAILILSFIPIVRIILRTNQGFDFTDEGLYLLAANPSTKYQSWGFPFGWNTAPLLRLAGDDISKLRVLSAVILMFLVFVLSKIMLQDCFKKENRNLLIEFFIPYCIALSTLYFYVGYIRIPGYNWLNITGIVVSLIGYKIFLKNYSNFWHNGGATFIISAGFLISIPGKPTSALYLFCALSTLISFFHKEIKKSKFMINVFINLIISVFFLVLLKIWPSNFLDYFINTLESPKLTAITSPLEALKQTLLVPFLIPYHFLSNLTVTQFLYVSFLVFSTFLRLKFKNKSVFFLAFNYCLFLIFILEINGIKLGFKGFEVVDLVRIDKPELFTSFLIVFFFVLVNSDINFRKFQTKDNWVVYESIFLLLSSTIVFGFGSTSSPIGKASSVVFLVLLAIFLFIYSWPPQDLARKLTVTYILGLNLVLLFLYLNPSISKPYRIKNFSEQTSRTPLLNNSNYLFLDTQSKKVTVSLRNTLLINDYDQKYPLLDLSSTWQPGLLYLLEARNPDSLILTIPGYSGSYQVLESNLKVTSEKADLRRSWILLSSKRNFNEENFLNNSLILLGDITELSFPNDYTLLIDQDGFQLWKPNVASP
jgi:hypothetical protein